MRNIEAYQCVDGLVFTDEKSAKDHEIDLLGEELDGLLMHVLKLDVSARDKQRGILAAIDERKALKAAIIKLQTYLCFDDY